MLGINRIFKVNSQDDIHDVLDVVGYHYFHTTYPTVGYLYWREESSCLTWSGPEDLEYPAKRADENDIQIEIGVQAV